MNGTLPVMRAGFDRRVVWALRMVGVNLGEHTWYAGRRGGQQISFTFHGDLEMTKGVIQDFIEDEFNGTNLKFFARLNNPHECYVIFDEGRTECARD